MNDNFKKINEILLAFNNIQSKGLRKFKECIPDEYNNKEYILHSINKLEDSLNCTAPEVYCEKFLESINNIGLLMPKKNESWSDNGWNILIKTINDMKLIHQKYY